MKPVLYSLSYTRIHAANSAIALHDAASILFVPPAGIEPAHVAGLQPAALTKLSYRGFILRAAATSKTRRDAHSSDGGTRTRDPRFMKPVLYQLSYARIHAANSARTLSHTLRDAASIYF